jgi:hypothetical protein
MVENLEKTRRVPWASTRLKMTHSLQLRHKEIVAEIDGRNYDEHQLKMVKDVVNSRFTFIKSEIKALGDLDEFLKWHSNEQFDLENFYLPYFVESGRETNYDQTGTCYTYEKSLLKVIYDESSQKRHFSFRPNNQYEIDDVVELVDEINAKLGYYKTAGERLEFLFRLRSAIRRHLTHNIDVRYVEVLTKRDRYRLNSNMDFRLVLKLIDDKILSANIRLVARTNKKDKIVEGLKALEKKGVVIEPLDNFLKSCVVFTAHEVNECVRPFKVYLSANKDSKSIINHFRTFAERDFYPVKKDELKFWIYSILSKSDRVTYTAVHDAIYSRKKQPKLFRVLNNRS